MSFISQLIHQNPELSGVVKAGEKYIPFVLIAAAKGFFDHATGISSSERICSKTEFLFGISQYTKEPWYFIFRNICVYCVDRHVFSC